MITLFEGYLAGMLAGMVGSLNNRRYLALAFFYAVMIVSAHFYLLPVSHILGPWFYFGAGRAQLLILVAALLIRTPASAPVALFAYCAVMANVSAFGNYPGHGGIYPYYYTIINTVQVMQIASLAFFSPAGVYLYRIVTGKVKVKRMQPPWMHSKYHSGT